MHSNKAVLVTGCVFLIALCLALFRDISLEKIYPNDLRNRVVGARLQKDGKAPYFYNWHQGDSIRYYDPNGSVGNGVSNITASPFFHTLLYPLAELQQRTISRIWLLLEYLMILITGFLAYRLARNNAQKNFVLIAFILFIYTEGWKYHIAIGQNYLVLPFLAMVFYYCITKPESRIAAFIAGLSAISLVLIKPNTVVFFLPFLFLTNAYPRKYLAVLLIPVIVLPTLYFSFENNRIYWKQYLEAVKESIKVHQDFPLEDQAPVPVAKVPQLKQWEGWDMDKAHKHELSNNIRLYSEHGNVFVIYSHALKKRLSVDTMHFLSGLSIVTLLIACFWIRKKYGFIELPNLAILGFCMYMIVDLLLPIWRHQYYTVQWLFPLLIAAAVYRPANRWFYAALLIGLLFNIVNTPLIKMEHTIGEYLLLIVLLCLSLTRKLNGLSSSGG